MTCPDITFAVSTLSQYLKAPHTTLLHAVTRVFRYLSGTKEYKLVLGGTDTSIFGDADSDYASQIHPHSISAFFISKGVVSWSSKKQPIRLNMSLLHMPQKISSGFKKFSKFSHLYFLIPLQKISTVTTKARSVYPRTQLFTVTPNILMFIFILFGKQFFNVISLYSIVLWMIWLQTPSLFQVWEVPPTSWCFLIPRHSRGGALNICWLIFYFILFYLFYFLNSRPSLSTFSSLFYIMSSFLIWLISSHLMFILLLRCKSPLSYHHLLVAYS